MIAIIFLKKDLALQIKILYEDHKPHPSLFMVQPEFFQLSSWLSAGALWNVLMPHVCSFRIRNVTYQHGTSISHLACPYIKPTVKALHSKYTVTSQNYLKFLKDENGKVFQSFMEWKANCLLVWDHSVN